MLRSEEGQLNAVFACFGSAAQHAQFFEAALGEFLLAYNKVCNTSLTLSKLEEIEQTNNRKTMGNLLAQMRKRVNFDDNKIDVAMDSALQ